MRIRQEAKIAKNYIREIKYKPFSEFFDIIDDDASRYNIHRVDTAFCRLEHAMKRRYTNQAKDEFKKNGDSSLFRLLVHKANSIYLQDDALAWWNIKTD